MKPIIAFCAAAVVAVTALAAEEWERKAAIAAKIDRYLTADYTSKVERVTVDADSVTVSGFAPESEVMIAELMPCDEIYASRLYDIGATGERGAFRMSFPRYSVTDGVVYDRALSRWAVAGLDHAGRAELRSHARYADTIAALRHPAPLYPKTKKGIAAGFGPTYYGDFKTLGAHSITMNTVLDALIMPAKDAPEGWEEYTYLGRRYGINPGERGSLDATTLAAQRDSVVVSAILLTRPNTAFHDPENTGGNYTMPNMTTPEAVALYAAALNYMADRYSTADSVHGRVHHWIMHNEVDMPLEWTNMGPQPMERYLDRYMKSMRMCYNIVRQYDPEAWVLASYTHNWNCGADGYRPLRMLERQLLYSAKEGDFRWGVAYHPYPIDLGRPQFWDDDLGKATLSDSTMYVTFMNPEVIDRWVLDRSHFYCGYTKRLLFFSEQGTNSPDYSEESLRRQAAGAAWIWKKLQRLKGVDAMQWHAWADNRQEYGLRIGLRSFADGDFGDFDTKPAWEVWKAAGTPEEDTVFGEYLPVIGIASWEEVFSLPARASGDIR